jgi:hypothetical protein
VSVPVVCLAFYSPKSDSYIVTQGLIKGRRVTEPLYRSYGIKCQYTVMMARAAHGIPRPVGLDTW